MRSDPCLWVKGKAVLSFHGRVLSGIHPLFFTDQLLHFKGSEAAMHTNSWDTGSMSAKEMEKIEAYVYAVPARLLKDRLEVLGISKPALQVVFEASVVTAIKLAASFKEMEEWLEKLKRLTFEAWLQHVKVILASGLPFKKDNALLDGLFDFRELDSYKFALRTIVECLQDTEVVELDVTAAKLSGRVDGQEMATLSTSGWESKAGVPIIITEGTFDVQVLKGALEILKPHLAQYIRFLDYSFKNEGSASVAVNTLKSFAAAGISNRIVAIFDNDSAAYEAATNLEGVKLPPHFSVIHYPDIALANEYPTLGPTGNVSMNVNRLAGSIELYLGTDVLRDGEGNFTPVQWKGYMSKIKAYQGELFHKSEIQKAFNEKLRLAKADRKNIEGQDWSGLNAIFDKLEETLSEMIVRSEHSSEVINLFFYIFD